MSVGHKEVNGKVSVDLSSVGFVHNEYIELLKPVYWQLLLLGIGVGESVFSLGKAPVFSRGVGDVIIRAEIK